MTRSNHCEGALDPHQNITLADRSRVAQAKELLGAGDRGQINVKRRYCSSPEYWSALAMAREVGALGLCKLDNSPPTLAN